ncbi:hypothetical protein [Tsukamurella asaccharolytica]|uniref:hypothetical protein n=1 Tax=Tsukamurella asaccharolytica TaxID=2592067 RepID=UPI0013152657|nr:hypothetical protein [Tsukamurella asaccharolytica]
MDQRALIALAVAHGWRLDTCRRHLRLIPPPCRHDLPVLVLARTPSDWRGTRNLAARLRRAGVPVPHRGGRCP